MVFNDFINIFCGQNWFYVNNGFQKIKFYYIIYFEKVFFKVFSEYIKVWNDKLQLNFGLDFWEIKI